ncbi:MAG: porin family protein [Chlorobi bacterium]|nr:porin family protein [Chlorobiota bacterium]
MKNLWISTLLFLFFFPSEAQLLRGNVLLNAAAGVGLYEGRGTVVKVPPLSASFEYMVSDLFSAGLEGGYYSFAFRLIISRPGQDDYQLAEGDFDVRYGAVTLNYHFINLYTLDVYGGVKAGRTFLRGRVHSETGGGPLTLPVPVSRTVWGVQLGVRYMFTPRFGAFAELGYGTSVIRAGLSWRWGS